MDILYIGAVYDAGVIQYEDGSALPGVPTLVLFNRTANIGFQKNGVAVSGTNGYSVRFAADETIEFTPGMYDIEVYLNYDDDENREVIAHMRDAVKAVQVYKSVTENA